MKKLTCVLIAFCFVLSVNASIPKKNLPQGTFKKKRNGTIIQYNDKGKKIGIYKLENGRYKKIK